jgi:hypothetical protein
MGPGGRRARPPGAPAGRQLLAAEQHLGLRGGAAGAMDATRPGRLIRGAELRRPLAPHPRRRAFWLGGVCKGGGALPSSLPLSIPPSLNPSLASLHEQSRTSPTPETVTGEQLALSSGFSVVPAE